MKCRVSNAFWKHYVRNKKRVCLAGNLKEGLSFSYIVKEKFTSWQQNSLSMNTFIWIYWEGSENMSWRQNTSLAVGFSTMSMVCMMHQDFRSSRKIKNIIHQFSQQYLDISLFPYLRNTLLEPRSVDIWYPASRDNITESYSEKRIPRIFPKVHNFTMGLTMGLF